MNPVVHFEMPYDDAQRVSKFYRTVFGWNMQPQGETMAEPSLRAGKGARGC